MIYVNVFIVIVSVILAILSRKHYSKYKGAGYACGTFMALVISLGECAWTLLEKVSPLDSLKHKIAKQLRKSQVVSSKKLDVLTDEFIAKSLGVGLVVIFAFNLVELGSTLHKLFLRDEKNIIEREEYGGDVIKEEIAYEVSGENHTVVLEVSPVRLSEEDFYEKAQKVADDIEKDYLKKGTVISQDIELPLTDAEGVFDISWESNNPELVSSRGRIKTPLDSHTVKASLTMVISYHDYSASFDYQIELGLGEKSTNQLLEEEVEQALTDLEKKNPEEKEILIPREINGISISFQQEETSGGALMLGILFGTGIVVINISGISEKGRKRDRELVREYPYFVDSMWLYIESGMNIKRAIQQYVSGCTSQENILVEELKLTLNQIDNSQAEYTAYENLGARLEVPLYMNLMRHISQNLRMGTKDLRGLMETEVAMSLEARKEAAKKLGEEASTKLIFPMILLLLVIMAIIMVPAFMGF